MGIRLTSRGSFNNMERFLEKMLHLDVRSQIEPLAQKGVEALARATPVDSGLTAQSWGYEIIPMGRGVIVEWTNHNAPDGFPVAVMLQHGYGTGTGGYVQGRDYINPVIRPIFDEISDAVWKVVTSA